MQIIKTEIAIVGGGPGGQSAALQAAQLGRKAIIFEKKDHLGGAMNGGTGPFAVETVQQRRLQRVVTREEAFKFFMDYTHWQVDPGLVAAYVNKSADTVKWLEALGCVFDSLNAYIEGGNHTWHEYTLGPEGFITDRMWREEEKLGVEAILNCRVKKLTMKDGKVTGFVAEKDGEEVEVTAEAVVIATGGFGDNPEMVREYTPYELGKTILSMTQGCDGDGLQMAWEVGAEKGHMFYDAFVGVLHPMYGGPGGFCAPLRSFRQPNLMVNERAERFTNEYVLSNGAYGINAVRREPGGHAYMIVTDKIVETYKDDGFVITIPSKDPFTNQWSDWPDHFEETVQKLIGEGFPDVFMADSLTELAEQMGMDPEKLQATVDRYNQICEEKYDIDFHKRAEFLHPIKGSKFYAVRVYANAFGTLGGININSKAEVLDKEGLPIPGLYAAGNDANTICMDSYCFGMPGHTSGFAFNTGRIAAESIDEYLKK